MIYFYDDEFYWFGYKSYVVLRFLLLNITLRLISERT